MRQDDNMILNLTHQHRKGWFSHTRLLFLISLLLFGIIVQPIQSVSAQGQTSSPAQMNKNFTPDIIPSGGEAELSVNIYNPNGFPLTLSSVPAAWTDTLPDGVDFVSPADTTTTCGGTVAINGKTLSLIGGTVPAQVGDTPGSCTVTAKVTSIVAGNHDNEIPAQNLNATDPTGTISITNTTPATHTLQVNSIQPPSVSKSFAPNTQWVGQTSQLRVDIRNNDLNYPLTETYLQDGLPDNVVLADTSVSATNCGSVYITGPGGDPLASGQTAYSIYNATIQPDSVCTVYLNVTSTVPGVYVNHIPATAIQTEQAVTNSSAASAPINFQSIGLQKSFSPGNFQVGGTSTLTITIENPSSSPYTGVSFTDDLPDGLTIVPTPEPNQCGGTVTYSSGSLTLENGVVPSGTPQDPGTCTISATVTSSVAGSFTNTIPAYSLDTDQGATNVTDESSNVGVYGEGEGVTGSKRFSPTTIGVDGISRLAINIRAPQDTALTGFNLTDALPEGVQVSSNPNATKNSNCSGGSFNPTPGDVLLSYTGGTIPAGALCTLAVDVTAADPGRYENIISPANITNNENRNLSGNITRTLTVSGLGVSKSFYPSSVSINGLSVLTVVLENVNFSQLEDVAFSDTLPSGVVLADDPQASTTCVDATVNASGGGSAFSISGGKIPAQVGEVPGICTVNVTVKGLTTGSKRNRIPTGDVTGTLQGTSSVVSNPANADAYITVEDLTVAVVKSFDPLTVFGGAASTMTVRLTNPNNAPLDNISFTDNLPQSEDPENPGGMHIANPIQANTGSCGGTISASPGAESFAYSGGTLAANESCEISIQVTMDVGGNLTNTIPIDGVTTNNGAHNPQSASATLTNLPGVSITKYFFNNPILEGIGNISTLVIYLQNTGNVNLTGLGFTDTLPDGVEVATPPEPDQCGGTLSTTSNTITLQDGSLLSETDCTIQVAVTAPDPGTYENCISSGALSSDQEATNADPTCDTLVVEQTLLPPSISKQFAPDPVAVDEVSALTFIITNPNASTLSGVSFQDNFPTGLVRAGIPNVSQCGGTVASTETSVQLQDGVIPSDSSCSVVIAVKASTGGDYLNTSEAVTANETGEGNTASDTLQVLAPPIFSKEFSPDPITAGATTTLTFTLTNPAENTLPLEGIAFTDVFPTGVVRASLPVEEQCEGTVTSTDNSITLSDGDLAVGATCNVAIEVTAPNGGTYENISQPVTSTNGGEGSTATDILTVNGVGLSLLKTSLSENYKAVGDEITYQYQLTNTGNATLLAPFTVDDDKISSQIVCGSTTELEPGSSILCNAIYTIEQADIDKKSVVNTATANAKDEIGEDVVSNKSSVEVKYAGLTLQKTTNTQSYLDAGDSIKYTYILTNTGAVSLYAPFQVIDDHFVDPLVCGSATSLAPGAVLTCSQTYTVTEPDVLAGSVTNLAYANAKDAREGGDDVRSNNDDVTVFKVFAPTISKLFTPDSIQAGSLSTLTFTIQNPNTVSLTGVSFVDNLPTGVTPASTPQASQCGGTVSYDSGNNRITLNDGFIIPEGSCTVSVTITSSDPGDHLNQSNAVQSENGGTGNSAQDTLRVTVAPLINKDFQPKNILQSETSTLVITITNPAGNTQALTGVAFNDTFPLGLTVADGSAVSVNGCGSPTFSPNTGDASLFFSEGTIEVAGTCTITIPVAVSAPGEYENSTDPVTSSNGGTGLASNVAVLNASSATDLAITKDDGNLAVSPGESLVYTLQIINNGPSDAVGAIVSDTFPSTLGNVTWSCAAEEGAACTLSGTGNINDTVNIPIGKKLTYTVNATVSEDADTSIVNSASVVPPPDLVDPNMDNNIQTDTDLINLLQLEKTADQVDYDQIGETLTYTYTLTNIGTSTLLSPFTLTDDLAQVTCTPPVSLAPQAAFTCTGTYTVTSNDIDDGSITNHADATAQDADGDTVNSNQAEAVIEADQEPLIGIAKQLVEVEEVSPGTYDVTFDILIKNYGNVTLQAVQVRDALTDTFPSPASFSVQSIQSDDLILNDQYDGNADTELLDTGNSLAANEEKTLTLVVQVIPTSQGPYENSATSSGEHPTAGTVTDHSQEGLDPDPDENGDPSDNDDPTQVDFGAELFDPPYGRKDYDAEGRPILEWTMIWINNSNIVDINGRVEDPIPDDVTFQQTAEDSGYPVPDGAPAESTSFGVSCTHSPNSTTTLCYFEGHTIEYPQGRIIWEGTIAPDFGVTDPEEAENAVQITFNVLLEDGQTSTTNEATFNTDRNGDGDVNDPGEEGIVTVTKLWDISLPDTGFAPGVVTNLPLQTSEFAYDDLGYMRLQIPILEVELPIVGVPQTSKGDWNITWLDEDAGWLHGTAFPTWAGNSAITAHVYDSNGEPGPFANLKDLKWGDQIIINAWGQEYIYEVREVSRWVDPEDISVLNEEVLPWLTLITCRGYDEQSDAYQWRVVVRAVQIAVR